MKREIHSNHRLIVIPSTPETLLHLDHDATRARLDDMAKAIHRHVDHVGAVKVDWDTKAVCEFCGYEWETVTAQDLAERPEDYEGQVVDEPVCCCEAVAEFRAALDQTGGA